MTVLISAIYIIVSISAIIQEYKRHYITALLVFLLMQLIMFIGIILYADKENYYDQKLIAIYLLALVSILLGNKVFSQYERTEYHLDLENDISENQYVKLLIWSIVSIILCFGFFRNSEGNAFTAMFSGGRVSNIAELRRSLNYTSGSGIVYQFRVYILPITMIILISSTKQLYRRTGIILVPFAALYLLGSGQRGGLVTVMLVIGIVFLYRNNEMKKKTEISRKTFKSLKTWKKAMILLLVLAAIAFATLTVANGRVEAAGSLVNAIFQRIIVDNQGCAVYGFRNLVQNNIVDGHDWLMMTLELVPGVNTGYIATANRIFQMKYGSLRGTSPLCIWGSTYYNFGYLGVIILGLLIGVFYSYVGRSINNRKLSIVELVLYAGLIIILGTWVAEGPYYLINNGGVAIVLLYFSLVKSKLHFSANFRRL